MIGIATTFFWIFLIAFLVTAVYSVKDVSFNFGEPQMSSDVSGEMFFSLPVEIVNRGFYNIGVFTITTQVFDTDGLSIVEGSTVTPLIRKNEGVVIVHNMTFNASELLQRDENFLFNDTELMIYAAIGMHIAEAIPVQASTNFSMPWGAPLCDFTLGEPVYAPYNASHFVVTVPISFENHAFFDLAGDMRIRMYNSAGSRVGRGRMSFNAYANSPYSGSIDFYVSIVDVTPTGRFEVNFETAMFDYGPVVIPYG
jgi:hypothetical protein